MRSTSISFGAGLPASGEIVSVLFASLLTIQESYSPFDLETGHALTFQISVAYSPMVRSLENFPEPATFKMALRAHAGLSPYNAIKR
jgi:hypothetical protein